MKKKLIAKLNVPSVSKFTDKMKSVPQKTTERIKEMLETNKAGIWVSRFLMEYQVRRGGGKEKRVFFPDWAPQK